MNEKTERRPPVKFTKEEQHFATTVQSKITAEGGSPKPVNVIQRDEIRATYIADGMCGVTMVMSDVLHVLEPTFAFMLGDALKQEAALARAMSQTTKGDKV
jgi:hypothetical protein